MTTDILIGLEQAVGALRDVWRAAAVGAGAGAGFDDECGRDLLAVSALSANGLMSVNDAIGRVGRQLAAVHAVVAAEISHRSRPELGAESLAKQQGFRNPLALIASTTGTSNGSAARLVAVGQATTPRQTFSGVDAPAQHPHIADAVNAGRLGTEGAALIIAMLGRVAFRASRDALDRAELALAQAAPGISLDQLVKIIARAEAHLNPDGVEPRDSELRTKCRLSMFERDGMLHLNGQLDAESGAPVKAAIQALVSAEMRAAQHAGLRDGGVDGDRRPVVQMQADALALLARHFAGCENSEIPLDGATVVVRISVDELTSGAGSATIDGIDQPVSVSTVRRMAAGGQIIPCVLGGGSEILDWGRAKRLFTRAQKLALVERDGGCAMCGLAPGLTRAHHMKWWLRDSGPTDLSNGVLLCESCHHRIHDNGWEVRIDGPGTNETVWFIPPPHVDPARVPRPGGRARFDYAA